MRSYGSYVDYCKTIQTRDGEKGRSSLIYGGHKVKFKLQDVLNVVNLRKASEDNMNYFPVVVLTSDMVQNTKELIGHYLDQNRTGTWDP